MVDSGVKRGAFVVRVDAQGEAPRQYCRPVASLRRRALDVWFIPRFDRWRQGSLGFRPLMIRAISLALCQTGALIGPCGVSQTICPAKLA
jgi:hypothetical protein